MTIEEYEKIIQQSTDEAIQAQAKKNAAEAAAISTGVTGFASSQGQALTGGTGEAPDQVTEQERALNQAATENAVSQSTSSVSLPSQPAQKNESKEVADKIREAEIQRAQANLEKTALEQQKPAEVKAPAGPTESVPVGAVAAQSGQEQAVTKYPVNQIQQDEIKRAQDNLVRTSTAQLGPAQVPDIQAAIPGTDENILKKTEMANEAKYQNLVDYVDAIKKRQQQDEEEMRRQEQADMWSTMGTGATELAAGIINMFGVGGLNASNQVYKSYSQDWMRKADENIREHRKRRDNMRDTLDRLNFQMEEMRHAQSIQQVQMAHQLRKEKEAKEAKEREWAFKERAYEDSKKQQEIENAFKEKSLGIQEQSRKDASAQGWARINQARDAQIMQMAAAGYVPDKTVKGGFRFDPDAATKKYGVKFGNSKKDGLAIPLLAYNKDGADLPAETITVPDEATLKNTIFTNIAAVDDLSQDDKAAIMLLMLDEEMKADEKASALRQYLVKSGQLRSLLRGDSVQNGNVGSGQGWLATQYGWTPGNGEG